MRSHVLVFFAWHNEVMFDTAVFYQADELMTCIYIVIHPGFIHQRLNGLLDLGQLQ